MSGLTANDGASRLVPTGPAGSLASFTLDLLDRVLLVAASIAAVAGAFVLTESVFVRYFL